MSKVIHCCWFNDEEKPLIVEVCLTSWKQKMPDYEIKEWKADEILPIPFFQVCLERRQWAKASDFARWWILMVHGGLFLDMDIEILKPLSELKYPNFVGFDTLGGRIDNTVLKFDSSIFPIEVHDEFISMTGDESYSDVSSGLITKLLRRNGLKGYSFNPIQVGEVTVLPKPVLFPEVSDDLSSSYTRHYVMRSWMNHPNPPGMISS